MTKVLYIFDDTDRESRLEVAKEAANQGYEIVIGLISDRDDIQIDGFKTMRLEKASGRFGVLSSLRMAMQMRRIIRQERPDILHVVALKYSFIAGLAALFFRGRKIFTMAGLGYIFRGEGTSSNLLRLILSPLMKLVFHRKTVTLIFQNGDDLNLMVQGGYVDFCHTVLIKGSGVYLDRFKPVSSEIGDQGPLVLMPTRLVHEKGVHFFVEAARVLRARGVKARFQIAGGETKHNPKAITRAEMEEMVKDGAAEWLGRVENMPALFAEANLVVYPSYYGEGIPRVLLEACAAGRAIVTTDHPGCKEAVDDGENGVLVPVRDAFAVADAVQKICGDDALRQRMEKASKDKAEAEFNIYDIAAQTVAVYAKS